MLFFHKKIHFADGYDTFLSDLCYFCEGKAASTALFAMQAQENLFSELQVIAQWLPDTRAAYRHLNRLFLRCIDQKTNLPGIRFGGPFAKTDYLLKEHQAPRRLRAAVNEARVRFRQLATLDQKALSATFWLDWAAIAQFVSLLFGQPVPKEIERRFPKDRERHHARLTTECLRVIVNRWDDTYLYAEADDTGVEEVKVFYGGTSEHAVYREWDWSYLRSLLREGCQLNLVRPREHEGVLLPELIIFEPDYLVDISAVAACFENYSHSALNHLLHRLQPSETTSAMALGNLASQFLDETLCLFPEEQPYAQSVKTFFKNYALSLLTADLSPDFHEQAQAQLTHVREAIGHDLPALLARDSYKPPQFIVEPSFFSEMLGLQGRMDFLQLDHKVLMEQKSGKGGFPQKDPDTPVYQEKHYVQMLLYMLLLRYNYREQYEQNERNLQALLFYSKYKRGLVSLGFAPELVFKAMQTRNELVAREFSYTSGGLSLLTTLTADALNENHTSGVLWQRYQKPQIEALLAPIHAASELERAYYLRFLTFITTEHLMAKVGNQTKENSGFADKWYSSLEDKQLAGNIFCELELESPSATEEGRVEQVVLRFPDSAEHEISNFRTGDIVVLYPYAEGTEPDVRRTMVFRATIEQLSEERVTLHLRASQVQSYVFWHRGPMRWAIEHDFFESSMGALYRGVHAFLSAPKERRDLLLLQREPQVDKSLALAGNYGAFNDLALRVKQARDLFLIIGPPGTGKTSYGLMTALQEELLEPGSSVLLLSYTNRAVDEICSKLVEQQIDYIRVGSRFSCDEAYRSALLESRVQECSGIADLRALVERTRVFVGTTTAFSAHVNLSRIKPFSLAIIDEASQILEPHLLGMLSAVGPDGSSAIRKLVFIGDHKQLPAVVQQREEDSRVEDPQLRAIHLTNCRLSLFERLLARYRHNPDVVYMLTRQGRMHPAIADFPNRAFYQNRLQAVPCPHQTRELPQAGQPLTTLSDLLRYRRVAFVPVNAPARSASDKVNLPEAEVIADAVQIIYEQNRAGFSESQTVGVIVPYRGQIAAVRQALERSGIAALQDVTIDTVERFQGSQRDYIIYGFTIQKPYQLDFLTDYAFEEDGCLIDRKLNVAITRAREHLLLIGNPTLLRQNPTFAQLLNSIP